MRKIKRTKRELDISKYKQRSAKEDDYSELIREDCVILDGDRLTVIYLRLPFDSTDIVEALKKKDWKQKELFEEFYNICNKLDIKNTDFFRAAYNVLLNKDRGPKLAPFILTLGKEKVIELFEKV